MNSSELRDTIIKKLGRVKGLESMVTADINGNCFSAADIAFAGSGGENKMYRIAVIRHMPQKSFIQKRSG